MGTMRLAMPGRGKRIFTLQECHELLKKPFIEKDRGEIFTGRIEEAYCQLVGILSVLKFLPPVLLAIPAGCQSKL